MTSPRLSKGPKFPKPKDVKDLRAKNAVRVTKDGREICNKNAAGRLEYRMRTLQMADRQGWHCPAALCTLPYRHMAPATVTFQHGNTRGLGGGLRDDRVDAPGNCAMHYSCNARLGSRRVK